MKNILVVLVLLISSQDISSKSTQSTQTVWIDVRTLAEYQEEHLQDAILIPFDKIDSGLRKMGLAKDAEIFLYCRSGKRSNRALHTLEKAGYTNVVNIGSLENAKNISAQR